MKKQYEPLLFAVLISAGIAIGYFLNPGNSGFNRGGSKLDRILEIVNDQYVDSVDVLKLEETAIESFMQRLDPHSVYMPAQELKAANDELRGEFEGIGVEFNIHNDTVLVVTVISGGPADKAGLFAGDKIIEVESEIIAGIGIENAEVIKRLKGPKGTEVKIKIKRFGESNLLPFTITRGKIPLHSLAASYMLNEAVGYIKLVRFSGTTTDEFRGALAKLNEKGMKSLVLDLRGNPGGYLTAAKDVADEILDNDRLIVYTQGRSQPRREYKADKPGLFENGKVVLLMDENSASASEIVAGALQDWDKAVIIGRRSFGKGLVQDSYDLKDGSAIRLTISRYYTPLGRSIQRNYNNGTEAYHQDWQARYDHSELFSADSMLVEDSSQVFTTPAGKKLFGGGGIYPDIFVPLDTSFNVKVYNRLVSAQVITRTAHEYSSSKRNSTALNVKSFMDNWQDDDKILQMAKRIAEQDQLQVSDTDWQKVWPRLRIQIMAMIARLQLGEEGFYYVLNSSDHAILKSLEVLK